MSASSSAFGVTTARPPSVCSSLALSPRQAIAPASKITGTPSHSRRASTTKRTTDSSSIIPGPMQTACALPICSSRDEHAAFASFPVFVSGSAKTRASGTLAATSGALAAYVANCSLPAPARSAAVPASTTAPGVSLLPPTTSARPRSSLSPPSKGSGRGIRRRTFGVMTVGRVFI